MIFPAATAGAALPPPTRSSRPSQRIPIMVSAHMSPDAIARRFPRSGAGAVRSGASLPTKKSASPSATITITSRSDGRFFSLRIHGPSRRT